MSDLFRIRDRDKARKEDKWFGKCRYHKDGIGAARVLTSDDRGKQSAEESTKGEMTQAELVDKKTSAPVFKPVQVLRNLTGRKGDGKPSKRTK